MTDEELQQYYSELFGPGAADDGDYLDEAIFDDMPHFERSSADWSKEFRAQVEEP